MTQEELKQRFTELLRQNPVMHDIEQLYCKAVQCGALNISDEPAEYYRLPKIILYTALCAITDKWEPVLKNNQEEAENLKLFL